MDLDDACWDQLEERIGYTFTDRSLLFESLTHRSHRHEHSGDMDNQSLEYLGDAALSLAVATYLLSEGKRPHEGLATPFRSHLTDNAMLPSIGRRMGLSDVIQLGAGERSTGGADRDSNLADAVEAVFGAVHLDAGFPAVYELFLRLFEPELAAIDPTTLDGGAFDDNSKGTLQELLQKAGLEVPQYVEHKPMGPDHSRRFKVSVYVEGVRLGIGLGTRKQQAHQEAAGFALRYLQDKTLEEALATPPSDADLEALDVLDWDVPSS